MMIHTEVQFSAAHRLYEYPGNCQNLHGHTFVAEVWIEGFKLDRFGLLVDFREVDSRVKAHLDHKCLLNKADPLVDVLFMKTPVVHFDANPSAETIAVYILDILRTDMKVSKVRVYENDKNFAEVLNV